MKTTFSEGDTYRRYDIVQYNLSAKSQPVTYEAHNSLFSPHGTDIVLLFSQSGPSGALCYGRNRIPFKLSPRGVRVVTFFIYSL